jgi:Glycosyl transferases group 1
VIEARIRALVAARRRAADLRWRQPPRFTVHSRQSDPPTAYYLAPTPSGPSGGVRSIYRQVDQLRLLGIRAAVVHARSGWRAAWFPNDTPVRYPGDVRLGPRDVLVVPECYGPGLHRLPTVPRLVVFNQGAYHTFDRVPWESTGPGAPYAGLPNLVALLTVSHDSAELLRYAFPRIPVHVTRNVVDGDVFHPGPGRPARRIGFLTHRRAQEREQLLHLLRAHGGLDGWRLTPLVGHTEQQTAAGMRDCAVFLSFSDREGFGLPPAEAMASGCHVVGYPGMGGRDYFDPAFCSPVPDGDLLAFARAVAQACAGHDADPEAFGKAGRSASEHVLARYCAPRLREDLREFYTGLGLRD